MKQLYARLANDYRVYEDLPPGLYVNCHNWSYSKYGRNSLFEWTPSSWQTYPAQDNALTIEKLKKAMELLKGRI